MSTVSPPQGTWEGEDDVLASQVTTHACNWSLRSAQGNVPKRCFGNTQPETLWLRATNESEDCAHPCRSTIMAHEAQRLLPLCTVGGLAASLQGVTT